MLLKKWRREDNHIGNVYMLSFSQVLLSQHIYLCLLFAPPGIVFLQNWCLPLINYWTRPNTLWFPYLCPTPSFNDEYLVDEDFDWVAQVASILVWRMRCILLGEMRLLKWFGSYTREDKIYLDLLSSLHPITFSILPYLFSRIACSSVFWHCSLHLIEGFTYSHQ